MYHLRWLHGYHWGDVLPLRKSWNKQALRFPSHLLSCDFFIEWQRKETNKKKPKDSERRKVVVHVRKTKEDQEKKITKNVTWYPGLDLGTENRISVENWWNCHEAWRLVSSISLTLISQFAQTTMECEMRGKLGEEHVETPNAISLCNFSVKPELFQNKFIFKREIQKLEWSFCFYASIAVINTSSWKDYIENFHK